MAVRFQYNRTELTNLGKQLKMRQSALPTLKNKESALRISVLVAKTEADSYVRKYEEAVRNYDYLAPLWNEFEPGMLSIRDIELGTAKVAGIRVPSLKEIFYDIKPFNAFSSPAWYADGIRILKELTYLALKVETALERKRILEFNRKKTTQKVNLYEKVQIPGYQEAIRKIKRFLEDEENLSKASSKIVKTRHANEEEKDEEKKEEEGTV